MALIDLDNREKSISNEKIALVWVLSFSILVISFYQQYVQKNQPCPLCQWQRFLYFLVFLISPIGFIRRFNVFIKNALTCIFVAGFCLASYHAFVQFGWLNDRCAIIRDIDNMNDFIKMLEQPRTSCAKIEWKLFGLSATVYNAIFSLFAFLALNFRMIKRISYAQRFS